MVAFLENGGNIVGFAVTDGLEFLVVGDLQMRSHVIRTVPQADLEALVAKDPLLFAEDGISELGVEGRDGCEAGLGGREEIDAERIVRVDEPCV